MNKCTAEYYEDRDSAIHQAFCDGKKYKQIAHDFGLTESGVKQVLQRVRKRNNLPNGRNRKEYKK